MMAPVFAHGQLRLYLLALLESGPKHGYELITALSDRFGGTYRPSAGTIYPRLARLEEEGLVTRVDQERKSTYALTEAGYAELTARREDLARLEQDIEESVRARADTVRQDVRGTMRDLRADLAEAARHARERAVPYTPVSQDPRTVSHVHWMEAEQLLQRFRDELRADLRRADARGGVERLTVETLQTVLDSALDVVRRTLP
ncbi:PadR family transcriptional regulator [Cellulomonas sp.]|uniref:PadR family transcriptional regulator n=1 Tax=Cellulomonas sp. TaxID=40001 RepID=UPI00258EEA66|nr:PadR family transcriptional regulator [Cellulomonas sp.]MCR6689410.1 PadR family transcriptional regulator [Cellulomonas sp.]